MQKTRADINNDINSTYPTNNSKQISAEDIRGFEETINDSKFNLLDDDAFDVPFSAPGFSSDNVGDALQETSSSLLLEGTVQVGDVGSSGAAAVTGDFTSATKTAIDVSTQVSVVFNTTLLNTNYIPAITISAPATAGNQAWQAVTMISKTTTGFVFKVSERTNEAQDLKAWIRIVSFNG